MATWTLNCPKCKKDFTDSHTDDSFLENPLIPMKLVLPLEGLKVECPECGHEAVYRSHQFVYSR
jgi:endogenous inhibitor of DNA gyrase (YacG/DUF329 family)